jgi:IS5 family transposase
MKRNKKSGVFSDKVPVIFAIHFFKRLKTKETQKPPEVTMRKTRTDQVSIFDSFSNHDIGKELKAMSERLDAHREMLEWVALDLHRKDVYDTGRQGLPAESVLRCALLKQYRQLSYQELAFYLSDSASFQAFARLPGSLFPKKSVLQETISRIQPGTWERINQCLLRDAQHEKVESGSKVRIDSTVTATDIHAPSDSALLWDSVRVMVRLLEAAQSMPGTPEIEFRNHQRRAKQRARAIIYTRGKDKKALLYRDLIEVTTNTLRYLEQAQMILTVTGSAMLQGEAWHAEVAHYLPLIKRVIDQAERRVLQGERVPAGEKLFSLFEPHTDIIIKGSREIQYGHKLNLSSGKSGLILDVVVEDGNPADSERLLPLLKRHIHQYGRAPKQVAVDGGYASQDNLEKAKACGVADVAFHKKRGLRIEAMVKSTWVYRQLRNFRAGIEAGISCLKRAYGLSRCTWKGLAHFKSFVWSAVVAHNLALLARLKPA